MKKYMKWKWQYEIWQYDNQNSNIMYMEKYINEEMKIVLMKAINIWLKKYNICENMKKEMKQWNRKYSSIWKYNNMKKQKYIIQLCEEIFNCMKKYENYTINNMIWKKWLLKRRTEKYWYVMMYMKEEAIINEIYEEYNEERKICMKIFLINVYEVNVICSCINVLMNYSVF